MVLHRPFGIFFVLDLANQLFQNVFHGQNAKGLVVVIPDDGQLHPVTAHLLQHLVDGGFRLYKSRRIHHGTQTGTVALAQIGTQIFTNVDDANDVVHRIYYRYRTEEERNLINFQLVREQYTSGEWN